VKTLWHCCYYKTAVAPQHNTKNYLVCHLFYPLQSGSNLVYLYADMGKIYPNKPFLLILYGFPGSGKTYFARQLSESVQAAHLQSDRVRGELFEQPRHDKQENDIVNQLMDYMTEEFLTAGLSVVYDANTMRAGQRNALRELARRTHAVPLMVWFQLNAEGSYARNQKRDRRRADDKYATQWDKQTFEKIMQHMQNPTPNEEHVVLSGKHLFNTQLSTVMNKLRSMGVMNSETASQHVVKPGLVNLVPQNNQAGRVDMTRRNVNIR
jgi:predicted kinase